MSPEDPQPAAQDVTEAAAEAPASMPVHGEAPAEEIFFKIERLADLRKQGVLSEEEFAAKKAELLSRL